MLVNIGFPRSAKRLTQYVSILKMERLWYKVEIFKFDILIVDLKETDNSNI